MSVNFFRRAALAAVFAFGTPATADTLQDALIAAYNNSNLLEQNRAILRSTDEGVAQALAALRPQVGATAGVTYADPANSLGDNLTSTVGIGLDLLLYDGGGSRAAIRAARETVMASRASLVSLEQQVLLNAVQAYAGVLRDTRVVQLRQNNLRLITEELRAAQDRFDVGEVTRTDVAQAQARLAQARGALADAQGNLSVSREFYQAAVGQPPSNIKSIRSLPKLPATLAEAQTMALAESPVIHQAQSQVKADELNAKRSQTATRPQLSLNAGVGYNSSTDQESASVGLSLNVPIYQGGQLNSLRRRSLAAVHASRANLKQQALLVRQDVSNSWSTLSVANAQVRASNRQIEAAQVAFDGVREEAKLGSRTTLDVLDAEQALFDARTNRVVAQTQVYGATYQLLASIGLLTAEKLDLPVERYDPDEYFNAAQKAPATLSRQGKKLDRILDRYNDN